MAKYEDAAGNNGERETQQDNVEKKKKKNWFGKKDDVDAVMFVQATEKEEMKKEIQNAQNKTK